MSDHRPDWDNQFAESEDERNERLAERRKLAASWVQTTAGLFAQLRDLTKRWNDHEDIPTSQQIECAVIGRRLNEAGGVELMRRAYYDAKAHNPNVHVIQAYWDGIGDWRW